MWIVMDIGCIECGEGSNLVGLFTNEDKANKFAATLNEKRGFTVGQHNYEVFKLPEPNIINPNEDYGDKPNSYQPYQGYFIVDKSPWLWYNPWYNRRREHDHQNHFPQTSLGSHPMGR